MEQYYIHAIYIYSILSALVLGFHAGDDGFSWDEENYGVSIFLMIVFGLFGVIIWLGIFIWAGLRHLWDWLNKMFQIHFWWDFYFTKRFQNLPIEELRRINKGKGVRFNKDTFSHRMYWRSARALNARHDFLYLKDEVDTNF